MIPTDIPELDKEQTKQLIEDLKRSATKEDLQLWKDTIWERHKKIRYELRMEKQIIEQIAKRKGIELPKWKKKS